MIYYVSVALGVRIAFLFKNELIRGCYLSGCKWVLYILYLFASNWRITDLSSFNPSVFEVLYRIWENIITFSASIVLIVVKRSS